MIDFHVVDTLIKDNDVHFIMNKSFGINYCVYLTCHFKNNEKIQFVGSENNTIHFKLFGEDHSVLIDEILSALK